MDDTMGRFQTIKDVLILRRTGKQAKAKAYALCTEPVKKRKIDKETNADTWMQSNMRGDLNGWQDYINHVMDVSMGFDSNFNHPMIYMLCHSVEQIRQSGALRLDSADRHRHAYTMNLQD
jgi:hypothetical protein